jgi:hypothetical protein
VKTQTRFLGFDFISQGHILVESERVSWWLADRSLLCLHILLDTLDLFKHFKSRLHGLQRCSFRLFNPEERGSRRQVAFSNA